MLRGFLREALGETHFYRYADPLTDVIINVVEPGGGFPWHFDTNNYTVTLSIQGAESGGRFEYVADLRSPENDNYEGVAGSSTASARASSRCCSAPAICRSSKVATRCIA